MTRKLLLFMVLLLAAPTPAVAFTRAQYVNAARHAQVFTATGRIPVAHTARGSRCWGGVWHERYWHAFGHTIGALWVYQNGWCGNGRRITHDWGWHFRSYAWGLYCMTNLDSRDGTWDVYPSWRHGQIHGSLGFQYPWGCGGLRGGTSSLRIAADGYWDGRF